jgi:hypothetical protein
LIGLPDLEPELFGMLQHVLQLSLVLGCRHGRGPGALLRLARRNLGPLGTRTILSCCIGDERQRSDETESQYTHFNLPGEIYRNSQGIHCSTGVKFVTWSMNPA